MEDRKKSRSQESSVKPYEVDGLAFEFTPNGSPFEGLLMVTCSESTFSSHVNLTKLGSRAIWAKEVSELYGADIARLKRALNELCTLRTEEVVAAEGARGADEPTTTPVTGEQVDELVGRPGVLGRYVEDAAEIHGVVRERPVLKLQTLVALGAQLAPYPNGKPAGANLIITAEPGRGKNHVCDAVASLLPEDLRFLFESASAKSLYYRAEQDPAILKHRWIYPNEAEATDQLVEMLRPLVSGGKGSHLTVNKDSDGHNAAQELNVEGPASLTIPTVRNRLDGHLQTRMLLAELPDYEGRVAAHSRASSRLLLPNYAAEEHGPKVRAWQAALESLTEIRRVVFDLEHDEFCFDSGTVSHGARLWGNLLGLMLAHAWLEQRNREIMELANGERAVVATPEDYRVAYGTFKATCERSILDLSDTHRKILDAVYELQTEMAFSDGYSQRQIAEKAGLHHSTVGEHKTFLTKSAKLLKETEGCGLTLVAEAKPDWWRKGDEPLAGFPRPEQVRSWWIEKNADPGSETARHARHPKSEGQNPDVYAENGGGQPNRHATDTTRHPRSGDTPSGVADTKTAVADAEPASKNGLSKPKGNGSGPVAGVAGALGSNEQEGSCRHGYPEGVGCYLCDPNHPYRLKEMAKA
jgi:hypothetical protein